MLKKVVVIVTLLGCLGAVAPPADAHYLYVSGRLLYHSLLCEWNLKGVPNTDINNAITECITSIALVDTLCENPQNHNVAPGQAATQTVLITQEPFTVDELTGKGKATVKVVVEDDDIKTAIGSQGCVNPNWHLIDLLVRQVTINVNIYECVDVACSTSTAVLASTATLQCSLPAEFDFVNRPAQGTPYECVQVSSTHLK